MKVSEYKQIVDEVFEFFIKKGSENYFGEAVSQEEHALQAAHLASREGEDEETIIAALLHDIGHLLPNGDSMGAYGKADHEKNGADWLRTKGFSEKVTHLVGAHVIAKRYLTYKDENYYQQLSEASKKTLEYQGGRMNDEEAKAFEKDPYFYLIIKMRYWDEKAKETEMEVQPLAFYRDMLLRHLMGKHSHQE